MHFDQDVLLDHVEMTPECWIWLGEMDRGGYAKAGTVSAARLFYEWAGGTLEPGQMLRRRCGRRDCVRPTHMEKSTRAEVSRARRLKAPKAACKRGHKFTPENTRVTSQGRQCKECVRINQRLRYHRLKEQSET